jgi:hypothetical protein
VADERQVQEAVTGRNHSARQQRGGGCRRLCPGHDGSDRPSGGRWLVFRTDLSTRVRRSRCSTRERERHRHNANMRTLSKGGCFEHSDQSPPVRRIRSFVAVVNASAVVAGFRHRRSS